MTVQETLSLANARYHAGDAAAAAALCRRLLEENPAQADALHLLGLIAQDAGDAAQALDCVRRACAAADAPALYFSNLAELCRRAGLPDEGEAAARRAVSLEPDLPGAWNNLGILLEEVGRYEESKACLDRVLALTPANPEAHNNFGNTCRRLGLLVEAERHWLRALELREDYPEPHSNLATLCSDQGAYDRAAYHARRAIALAPRFADAYINLAQVETARGDTPAAIGILDRLLAFAPRHATAMAAKAIALQTLDQIEEALLSAQRAVDVAPDNAEAAHALGQIRQALGDTEGARAAFDRAASRRGSTADKAAASRALLLMELGDTMAATEAFEAAIRTSPRSASLYFNRADLKLFDDPADPDIRAMRAMIDAPQDVSAQDRTMLHFALGGAYLQLGESAAAFQHLDAGNRAKRATFSYDATSTSRWMQAIARTVDASWLGRATQLRESSTGARGFAPVFVLGLPRSGTTLVEQILASHPAVFGAGEMHAMAGAIKPFGIYPALVQGLDRERLAAVGANYRQAVQRRIGPGVAQAHRYVVDKMPANFLYAGLIHAALPEARIIHCRRDPVDTCLSCYSKLFTREQYFTYDQVELGTFYLDYQRLMAHWRAILPPTHFLDVDYEDIVVDLEAQARRMLDFLDLPWSQACVEFYRTARPVRTASVNQVRRPIYTGSAGRWKQHADHLQPLLGALRHPSSS